jgi:crotonobetainyl-CoA:carnitine CoA-transferase CaiB-like acyl-CoA transferase
LIYCSITGFGHESPESYRGVQAAIAHAISGIMATVGEDGDPPYQPPTSFADPNAGFQAAISICSALYEREHSGKGRRIDLSMLDSLLFFMGPMAERASLGEPAGWDARAGHLDSANVPQGTLRGNDGWLAIAVGQDDEAWDRTASVIGSSDLAGKGAAWRAAHRDDVYGALTGWLTEQTSVAGAERILLDHDVPAARVNSPDEMAGLAQLRERGTIQPVEHPIFGAVDATGAPYRFNGEKPGWHGPAPSIGQHNEKVLSRILGMSAAKIDELNASQVLFSDSGDKK